MGFIEENADLDKLIIDLIKKYRAISYDKIKYHFIFTNEHRLNIRLNKLCKHNIIKKVEYKNVVMYELIRD
jgi:uncharacterized protein YlbG (UPF0298 family)